MFPNTGQQETEHGNPREKGNTRNEPQCTLAFSHGHTPDCSKGRQNPSRELSSPWLAEIDIEVQSGWKNWNLWGKTRETEGRQKSEWALPMVLGGRLDRTSAQQILRGPTEAQVHRGPQVTQGWEGLNSCIVRREKLGWALQAFNSDSRRTMPSE